MMAIGRDVATAGAADSQSWNNLSIEKYLCFFGGITTRCCLECNSFSQRSALVFKPQKGWWVRRVCSEKTSHILVKDRPGKVLGQSANYQHGLQIAPSGVLTCKGAVRLSLNWPGAGMDSPHPAHARSHVSPTPKGS